MRFTQMIDTLPRILPLFTLNLSTIFSRIKKPLSNLLVMSSTFLFTKEATLLRYSIFLGRTLRMNGVVKIHKIKIVGQSSVFQAGGRLPSR
jgi:hypothetical protein